MKLGIRPANILYCFLICPQSCLLFFFVAIDSASIKRSVVVNKCSAYSRAALLNNFAYAALNRGWRSIGGGA